MPGKAGKVQGGSGGNLNNGANNGPFYWNANNGVTNANWNWGALGKL